MEPTQPSPKPRIGRPQKWNEEVCDKLAEDLDEWVSKTDEFLLEGWLIKHKLHYEHFTRFCERSELFREAYTRARVTIDKRLIELALTRKIDITALKFYLCNRSHNWKERPDISVSTTNNTTQVTLGELLNQVDGKSKHIIELPPSPPEPGGK
jgi:hypothetical protein